LQTQGLRTVADLRAFVAGSQAADFKPVDRHELYAFIEDTLRRFRYRHASRADKGVIRRYLIHLTGLSRAQVTRLIGQYRHTNRIRDRRGRPARPFATRFTKAD